MKNLVLFLFLSVLLASNTYSQEGVNYGKKLILNEKTPISELFKNPKQYSGKIVQVEGLIVKVCEKRGCWIDIASDEEFEKIRLKVDDGVIVFPLEDKGKIIIAEGVFEELIYTKEDLIKQGEHQAKEYGTTFDPKTVTSGKIEYRLKGFGAIVK